MFHISQWSKYNINYFALKLLNYLSRTPIINDKILFKAYLELDGYWILSLNDF